MSDQVNDYGSSRFHLIKACEDSLQRLGTDYIDIYHMQNFDAISCNLTREQVKQLDAACDQVPAYPYWHQRQQGYLNAAPALYKNNFLK
jgi:aryl-alcohol dehydrogenase-like predicted oxidoreductase